MAKQQFLTKKFPAPSSEAGLGSQIQQPARVAGEYQAFFSGSKQIVLRHPAHIRRRAAYGIVGAEQLACLSACHVVGMPLRKSRITEPHIFDMPSPYIVRRVPSALMPQYSRCGQMFCLSSKNGCV